METNDRPDIELVWDEYQSSRAQHHRDRLILHYAPLVKFVAARVASGLPSSVEHGDLVSYGMFGLIDAIEKFQPERGFKFETYATARIKGAILDELRSMDWVPRSVRSKARAIERVYQRLEAQMQRSPTDAEVASALNLTDEQYQATLAQLSLAGVAALDEPMGGSERGEAGTLGDAVPDLRDGPVALLEEVETRRLLAVAVGRLPERERLVLTLYYYERMTLAEIGQILGVTESRVCQIHTKAVLHLRARMRAAERASV